MYRKALVSLVIIVGILFLMRLGEVSSFVKKENGKAYIVDQRGEAWDVTQAESIGFKPEGFQYGIGRHAFTPLDDSQLTGNTGSVPKNHRIIGVTAGSEAKAYSISKLSRHEIANTEIGSKPIIAGY